MVLGHALGRAFLIRVQVVQSLIKRFHLTHLTHLTRLLTLHTACSLFT